MSDTSQRLLRRQPGPADKDWREQAACRGVDPDLFFPIGTSGPALLQIDEAKQVCRTCAVRKPCLEWALGRGEDAGVWGGTTDDERRILRLLRQQQHHPA
jgi:WhiB family redox-sensing transcriptional regulator